MTFEIGLYGDLEGRLYIYVGGLAHASIFLTKNDDKYVWNDNLVMGQIKVQEAYWYISPLIISSQQMVYENMEVEYSNKATGIFLAHLEI